MGVTMKIQVLSLGGGRQSTLCVILAALGKIPVPDFIVIADTGLEIKTTWDYLYEYTIPFAKKHNLPAIYVAEAKKWSTYGIYSSNGGTIMPMYTEKGGMMRKYCSGNWKRDVIKRFVAHKTKQPQTQQVHWIGYGVEEVRRYSKKVNDPRYYLPLVEAQIRQNEYEHYYSLVGLPMPVKSSCFCCPFRDNFFDLTKEEVKQTILLEDDINETHELLGLARCYFHSSRMSFEQAHKLPNKKTASHNCDEGCFT